MTVINDNVSRRKFLSSAFMTLGVGLGAGTALVRAGQFLIPEEKEKTLNEVLIAKVSDITEKEPLPIEIGGSKALLMKTEEGFVAFSRKCTDLGCLVSWDKANEKFVCPCHQGVYDKNGKNISGPPPRPLDRFEVVQKGDMLYMKVTV